MHLRIDGKSLRFRILQDEVKLLEAKKILEETLILPNKKITFQLTISDDSEMKLNDKNDVVALSVPRIIFQDLLNNSPSKEGVGKQFKDLLVSLEIDVMKKRKN